MLVSYTGTVGCQFCSLARQTYGGIERNLSLPFFQNRSGMLNFHREQKCSYERIVLISREAPLCSVASERSGKQYFRSPATLHRLPHRGNATVRRWRKVHHLHPEPIRTTYSSLSQDRLNLSGSTTRGDGFGKKLRISLAERSFRKMLFGRRIIMPLQPIVTPGPSRIV
jgi:hypothetical protein